MCYGGGPPSLTVGRLLDAAGWPRLPAMPCHNELFIVFIIMKRESES